MSVHSETDEESIDTLIRNMKEASRSQTSLRHIIFFPLILTFKILDALYSKAYSLLTPQYNFDVYDDMFIPIKDKRKNHGLRQAIDDFQLNLNAIMMPKTVVVTTRCNDRVV